MIYQANSYRYEQDTSWDLARLLVTLRVCDSYWWFSFNDRKCET